jgi:sec-independent protein translocase protein TatC
LIDNKELTVVDHLHELRKRLIISIICISVVAAVVYDKVYYLLNLMMIPIESFKLKLVYISITDGFITRVQVALFVGVILSSPLIIYEMAAFINPGLTKREKKFLYINVTSISILFLTGIVFGYFLILPSTLRFLITYSKSYMMPLLKGRSYFSFIGIFCLYIGLTFLIPYVLFILAKLSLLSSKTLRKWRKYVISGTLVVEGVLLPSVDFLTFITAAAPVILIYELSIWIVYFMERRRKKVVKKKRKRWLFGKK